MEKGLAALLLLLCCAGFVVTGTPAQFEPEEPNTALESLAQLLEEAAGNNDGFAEDEEESAEVELFSRKKGRLVYTRWGRAECPSGSSLVYSGRAAGAYYKHTGSGTNYICMPDEPEYYSSGNPAKFTARVYGAEYETSGSPLASLEEHNVPCAVCTAKREAVLMIPAKTTCPKYWRQEYTGYLMASYSMHSSPKTFVCVDKDAQPVPGEAGNHDGALFYHARVGSCKGLECPHYSKDKDLACVVCTR